MNAQLSQTEQIELSISQETKWTMTNGQSRDSGNLGHETQKQRQTKQKDDLYVV